MADLYRVWWRWEEGWDTNTKDFNATYVFADSEQAARLSLDPPGDYEYAIVGVEKVRGREARWYMEYVLWRARELAKAWEAY